MAGRQIDLSRDPPQRHTTLSNAIASGAVAKSKAFASEPEQLARRVMRGSLTAAALAGLMMAAPLTAATQKVRSPRQVQLIAMNGVVEAPGSMNSGMPEPMRSSAAPSLDAFRVHDFSRRYVEFRMAEEMAATQGGLPEAKERTGSFQPTLAMTSSIVVPGWMRATDAVAPAVSNAAACAPLPYRPSGLLRRDAEARRSAYFSMMSSIACEQGVPTGLLDAVIIRESGYNPAALSRKNAFGFAQLMPGTALRVRFENQG